MVFAALVPAPTTGPTEVAWLGGVLTKLWGAWLLSVLAGGGQWHVNFSVWESCESESGVRVYVSVGRRNTTTFCYEWSDAVWVRVEEHCSLSLQSGFCEHAWMQPILVEWRWDVWWIPQGMIVMSSVEGFGQRLLWWRQWGFRAWEGTSE